MKVVGYSRVVVEPFIIVKQLKLGVVVQRDVHLMSVVVHSVVSFMVPVVYASFSLVRIFTFALACQIMGDVFTILVALPSFRHNCPLLAVLLKCQMLFKGLAGIQGPILPILMNSIVPPSSRVSFQTALSALGNVVFMIIQPSTALFLVWTDEISLFTICGVAGMCLHMLLLIIMTPLIDAAVKMGSAADDKARQNGDAQRGKVQPSLLSTLRFEAKKNSVFLSFFSLTGLAHGAESGLSVMFAPLFYEAYSAGVQQMTLLRTPATVVGSIMGFLNVLLVRHVALRPLLFFSSAIMMGGDLLLTINWLDLSQPISLPLKSVFLALLSIPGSVGHITQGAVIAIMPPVMITLMGPMTAVPSIVANLVFTYVGTNAYIRLKPLGPGYAYNFYTLLGKIPTMFEAFFFLTYFLWRLIPKRKGQSF